MNDTLAALFNVGMERGYLTYDDINNVTEQYGDEAASAFVDELDRKNIKIIPGTPQTTSDIARQFDLEISPLDYDPTPDELEELEELGKRKRKPTKKGSSQRDTKPPEARGKEIDLYHTETLLQYVDERAKLLTSIVGKVFAKLLEAEQKGSVDDQGISRIIRGVCGERATKRAVNLFNGMINIDRKIGDKIISYYVQSPISMNEIEKVCLDNLQYYGKYKELKTAPVDEEIGLTMSDIVDKPEYRIIAGLNEDSFGFDHVNLTWRGALCEGKRFSIITLSGQEALFAMEIAKVRPLFRLEEDSPTIKQVRPSKIDKQKQHNAIMSDLDLALKREFKRTFCIKCQQPIPSGLVGSDYCGKICADKDADDLSNHHTRYVRHT